MRVLSLLHPVALMAMASATDCSKPENNCADLTTLVKHCLSHTTDKAEKLSEKGEAYSAQRVGSCNGEKFTGKYLTCCTTDSNDYSAIQQLADGMAAATPPEEVQLTADIKLAQAQEQKKKVEKKIKHATKKNKLDKLGKLQKKKAAIDKQVNKKQAKADKA